jgi:hypothetical protein
VAGGQNLTFGRTLGVPKPASNSVLEAIDSHVPEQYAFYRTVIYLPHGAKYNPEQAPEHGVSELALVI